MKRLVALFFSLCLALAMVGCSPKTELGKSESVTKEKVVSENKGVLSKATKDAIRKATKNTEVNSNKAHDAETESTGENSSELN